MSEWWSRGSPGCFTVALWLHSGVFFCVAAGTWSYAKAKKWLRESLYNFCPYSKNDTTSSFVIICNIFCLPLGPRTGVAGSLWAAGGVLIENLVEGGSSILRHPPFEIAAYEESGKKCSVRPFVCSTDRRGDYRGLQYIIWLMHFQ